MGDAIGGSVSEIGERRGAGSCRCVVVELTCASLRPLNKPMKEAFLNSVPDPSSALH